MREPAGYLEFTALLRGARALVTDSGGAQKEAYFHGIPCVTLRDTTEWVETVESGWNVLAGDDAAAIRAALARPRPAERPRCTATAMRRSGSRRCCSRRAQTHERRLARRLTR